VVVLGRTINVTGPSDKNSRYIGPVTGPADIGPENIISPTTSAPGTTANATAQAASSENSTAAVTSSDQGDDDKKKKKEEVALAQKVGRVTVILPAKSTSPNSSQKQTATQPL
jgi:hypothetical protein